MVKEFWIEKTWSESINDALIIDANNAIIELINTHDPSASFWIGHVDEAYVLGIQKDLKLFLIYGENLDKRLKMSVADWEKVDLLVKIFFDKDFSLLKNKFTMDLLNSIRKIYTINQLNLYSLN